MKVKNELEITSYMHCKRCLEELPKDESPKTYARYAVGWTKTGLQVWCNRHNCNIVNIDFEGQQHPANVTSKKEKLQ